MKEVKVKRTISVDESSWEVAGEKVGIFGTLSNVITIFIKAFAADVITEATINDWQRALIEKSQEEKDS